MPETYGSYTIRETNAVYGAWSVADAVDRQGQTVRLTTLRLSPQIAEAALARFASAFERSLAVRTADAAAPGVPAILGGGVQDGVVYLAEAMPHGPSLRKIVAGSGPLPAEQAVSLLHGVAAALDPMHSAGHAHAFLVPDNVYPNPGMPEVAGQMWSSVFGMLNETAPGFEWPEAAFVAPELRAGSVPDAHAEVFSAAALAAFAVTGSGPVGRFDNAPTSAPPVFTQAIRASLDPVPDARYNGVKEMMVEVAVEQAIALQDTSESAAVPTGGDVPDWAASLLVDTSRRRSLGQPAFDLPAAAAPPTPERRVIEKEPPPKAISAPPVAQPPPAPRPAPSVAPGPARFDWNQGERRKSPVTAIIVAVAVVLVIIGIALTIAKH